MSVSAAWSSGFIGANEMAQFPVTTVVTPWSGIGSTLGSHQMEPS